MPMRREGTSTDSNHVLVTRPGAVAADADVPRTPNVLGVAYDHDAEDWLGRWRAGPDRVAVVSVGEHSRSAASTASGSEVLAASTGVVETVTDAEDVAAVGTLVNDYLSAWSDDGRTTVYLDGLSGLLEHVSAETAFRFAHAVLSRASSVDARVVAALDTDRHPPHVAKTFGELFDDVQA